MRVLLCVLALTLGCTVMALAADSPSSSPSQSGQALLDACISKCLNVSTSQIGSLRARGCNDQDICMACAIAKKCGKPVEEVAVKFTSSKDWKTVAAAYDLSMGDVASATTTASADTEAYNTQFYSQYYSIPQSTITDLRRQGHSWDDINMLANAAVQTKQPISQIASLRSRGMSWSDIAARYNVSAAALINPVNPVSVAVVPPGFVCPPTGAGPIAPMPMPVIGGPCVICNGTGNILLTLDMANQFYASGYDWLDVAVAVNISMYTGYPIRQVLTDMKSLGTWQQTIVYYGMSASDAFNVADYPFPRRSVYSSGVDAAHVRMIARYQCPGKYPVCPPQSCMTCAPPLMPPQVVAVPCPNPCPVPGTTVPGTTMPSTTTPGAGPYPTVPGTTVPAPTAPVVPSTPSVTY